MWRAWKMTELHTGISRKSLKERTRLGDLGIEDRITLKYILNKYCDDKLQEDKLDTPCGTRGR